VGDLLQTAIKLQEETMNRHPKHFCDHATQPFRVLSNRVPDVRIYQIDGPGASVATPRALTLRSLLQHRLS
jgi:hypothetical protein